MYGLYEFVQGISVWLMGIVGWIFDFITLQGVADWFRSSGVVWFLTNFIVALLVFIVGFLVSITFIWEERKVLGRLMDRRGTQVGVLGLFQNFADGLKAFVKEIIIPTEVDKWVYDAAPVILIGFSALMIGLIPMSDSWMLSNLPAGLLMVFAIFSIAPFAILIGGWASNNKYTVMGGMRAAAQLISYEVPLLLSLVGVVVLVGSFSFADIVHFQQSHTWLVIPQIIGFIVFTVAAMAEVERIPFDLPEAEAELVEGWMTEYGGMRFGLMMLSEYIRAYAACSVAVLLFLGGWDGPSFIWPEIWFILKVLMLFALWIWVRGALVRVTTKQILSLGWTRLLPLALVNLAVAVTLRVTGVF
jgi:NADH-quinone oxidoreductase subunit H